MMTRSVQISTGILSLLLLVITGCAQVTKEAGFGDVQKLVHQRIDYRLHWNQGSTADGQVVRAIDDLLKKELSVDGAVQIALLNNQHLQAVYEDLGVTQADVVEAGLLENPVFFGQARFPDRSPSMTNLEFEITQNFLNILMLPARKKLAALQFEEVKLRVADEVLKLAAEVRAAYYRAIGSVQIEQMRQHIAEAAEASYELARRMHTAGNISDLNLAGEQGHYELARMDYAQNTTLVVESREQLIRLLGLWGAQVEMKLAHQLPDVPAREIALEHLESLAIKNRLDLASARQEIEVMAQALGITLDWRWFGTADVGISTERDPDGQWVTGPSLTLELPIFNQRQADIARLEARLRQSQKRLAAQAVHIRSEVRSLRNRLMMKRHLVEHYKAVVLPLQERIVHLTLQEYNYMLTGVFDLLIARQNEFDNYQKYIETVRDYWITRTQIQRVVGGRLPPPGHMDTDDDSPEKSKKSKDNFSDRFSESLLDSSSQDKILGKQDKK
jgi:cobalt-zinc-cadmium efflux system outer membrane protein